MYKQSSVFWQLASTKYLTVTELVRYESCLVIIEGNIEHDLGKLPDNCSV
ncbi:hypothetical protein HS5_02280 [Acidianus sp. HS-5]|nr:hypothetical protein HS5_02280 [Acidianus sp. HS-5]